MTGAEPCRFLEWDSRHFGLRIARVESPRLTPELVASIKSWCDRNTIDCAYFLADGMQDHDIAEKAGFRRIDTRITLQRDPGSFQPDDRGIIRRFEPDDLPNLCRIARASHHDTRFYKDVRFPREKCDDLYETWIRKSCGGDAQAIFVAAPDGPAVGYLTGHLEPPEEGKIGLFAVAGEARRRGLGRALLFESLRWFRSQSVRQVSVVTQPGALAFYTACKFQAGSFQYWYHGWFRS